MMDTKDGKPGATAPGLALVATPIGNLRDITLRAIAALKDADVIACEDKRVTAKLLAAHGIGTPLIAYHEHNAERTRPRLLARLRAGERVALVSDAGTPLVSDPGYKLVRACREEDIPVTVLPGPSAVLAALVLSGLPTNAFQFQGFLPARAGARKKALTALVGAEVTTVLFESPRRIAATLADAAEILGARDAALARELTKLHEEVVTGTLTELATRYSALPPPKGEVVLVIGPAAQDAAAPAEIDDRLKAALAAGTLRDAVANVVAETGAPRRIVYARALTLAGAGK
jgi:16S rRNA (cytidine1402-2'-O)-methyltransferase